MANHRLKLLLIDGNPDDARIIRQMLLPSRLFESIDFTHCSNLAAAQEHLLTNMVDVILLDLTLPDSHGIRTLKSLRHIAFQVPIVLLTGEQNEPQAVEAMQIGVQDYLIKGKTSSGLLQRAVRNAIERQRLMAELANKAAELEQMNRELDDFSHTMAHQIQGLLSQMIGYTGVIEMNYRNELGPEIHSLLRRILQSGHKMNNVISEVMLLASVRSGEVVQLPLDMKRLVAEARKRVRFRMEEYQGEIHMPDSWPLAAGYPSWIEEVWVNYISNGLKYGGSPPKLILGFDRLQESMIRFWVKDNGNGLSTEDQRKLFTPHTRLRQTKAQGKGLGLSIVRRIVEKCGGQVGVFSQLGEGSTFWFTLPKAVSDMPDC